MNGNSYRQTYLAFGQKKGREISGLKYFLLLNVVC